VFFISNKCQKTKTDGQLTRQTNLEINFVSFHCQVSVCLPSWHSN